MNDMTKHMLREIIKLPSFNSEWFWEKQRNLIRMIQTTERCYLTELIDEGFISKDMDIFIPNKDRIREVLVL